MKKGRVLARCLSCGEEAISQGPGMVAVITHKDNCATMPVLCKMSNTELWQFYIRMNHVIKTCKDTGVLEDALIIKGDIIRDIRRRRRHA